GVRKGRRKLDDRRSSLVGNAGPASLRQVFGSIGAYPPCRWSNRKTWSPGPSRVESAVDRRRITGRAACRAGGRGHRSWRRRAASPSGRKRRSLPQMGTVISIISRASSGPVRPGERDLLRRDRRRLYAPHDFVTAIWGRLCFPIALDTSVDDSWTLQIA